MPRGCAVTCVCTDGSEVPLPRGVTCLISARNVVVHNIAQCSYNAVVGIVFMHHVWLFLNLGCMQASPQSPQGKGVKPGQDVNEHAASENKS